MTRPTYVKVAGWLLVIPATIAWVLPGSILRDQPLIAGALMAVTAAVAYGLFAVNLGWPLAWLTAGWGSLILAVAGVAMVGVKGNGLSLLITVACMPIAVLLLGPAESRAWFRS